MLVKDEEDSGEAVTEVVIVVEEGTEAEAVVEDEAVAEAGEMAKVTRKSGLPSPSLVVW